MTLTRTGRAHTLIPHDVQIRRASNPRGDLRRRRAWGEGGADDGETSRNKSWRGTNPSPWNIEDDGDAGEGGEGCNGHVSRSRTNHREGIASLPGVRDANAVRLGEGNSSSQHTYAVIEC